MKKIISVIVLSFFCPICFMAQTVEVKYFHGKQRCVTCRSIEKYAQEVLKENFAQKVKEGKVKFTVIDFTTDEGKTAAKEYKVTYSSLFVVKGKARMNLTHVGFKYAKNQPKEFKLKLKEAIESQLKDDLL